MINLATILNSQYGLLVSSHHMRGLEEENLTFDSLVNKRIGARKWS